MRVNKIKFTQKEVEYNFYFPIDGKRQTKGYQNILLGKTYPPVKNFSPKLILDVGANLGATSMFFALTYPKAKIYSFEPTQMNFRWLQKNTKNFLNVTRIKKGAYYEDIKAKIYLDSESGGKNSIYRDWTKSNKYEIVELINFGTFLESKNLGEKIDILKIDTEGCEIAILSSMQHYLKKVQVIYLEYHGKKNEEIALDILSESHITLQKKGVSQSSKKVNTELIGDFCAEDITVKGVTILKSGNKITETHIKELQRLLVETIPVFSDDLGEIVFLNKNLVLSSS